MNWKILFVASNKIFRGVKDLHAWKCFDEGIIWKHLHVSFHPTADCRGDYIIASWWIKNGKEIASLMSCLCFPSDWGSVLQRFTRERHVQRRVRGEWAQRDNLDVNSFMNFRQKENWEEPARACWPFLTITEKGEKKFSCLLPSRASLHSDLVGVN